MSTIIKLDKTLANQISAWEVVERPISIVKELVENSIDAGSSNIKIEIKSWWIKEIIITDNWKWIKKEELKLALEKYSTSKIKSLEDLYNVMTFWFRWEALSSISSISKLKLISKINKSISGYSILSIWWEISDVKEFNLNNWTKIIVKELFFNTPARLNYLKKIRTEYYHILDFLNKMLLSYPKIWFEFISDNKQIFKYLWNENLKTRIYNIYGEEFLNNLIEINFWFNWLYINWYITDPKISFSNKNRQSLFINNRVVNSPIVYKAIMNAYNRFISSKTQPGFILNLKINPTEIDVNVHPRKMELRFANEKDIFSWVYNAIFQRLNSISLITDNRIPSKAKINENENIFNRFSFSKEWQQNQRNQHKNYYTWSGTKFKDYSPYKNTEINPKQTNINDTIQFSKKILWEGNKKEFINISNDLHETIIWKIIWQIHNSYIIIETKDGIKILDQHALAERIIYEKLKKIESNNISQKLLFSKSFNLTPKEINIINSNINIFNKMWFDIEILSNGIIIINSIPNFIIKEDIENIFLSILEDIWEENIWKSKTLEEIQNKIFAYTACRSAIKFGNKLSLFEMNKLLNDSVLYYSNTCPHWRPVVFDIWLDKLKNKYER